MEKRESNKLLNFIIPLLTLISVVIVCFGLRNFITQKIAVPSVLTEPYAMIILLLLSAALIIINELYFRKPPVLFLGLAIFIVSITFDALYSLLTVLFFIYASFAMGLLLLKIIKYNSVPHPMISVALGTVVYGVFANFAAFFPINYYVLYFIICAFPIIILKFPRFLLQKLSRVERRSTVEIVLWIILTFLLAYYFMVALMPEIGHDALAGHLFIPNYVKYNAMWDFNFENYAWAGAYLGDWLYTILYILDGERSARLLNFAYMLMIMAIASIVLRLFIKSRIAELFTSVLILLTPMFLLEVSSLYIDLVWTYLLLAFTYVSLRYKVVCAKNSIILGVLIGGAISAKLITFLFIPAFAFLYLSRSKVGFNFVTLKCLFLLGLAAIIASSGTILLTYYYTGNPVFPFYNGFFKSPYFPDWSFDNTLYNSSLTFTTLYDITFNSSDFLESYDGAIGFFILTFFLATAFFIFSSKHRDLIILFTISIVAFASVFAIQSYLRYVLPVFIIWIVCIVTMIFSLVRKQRKYLYLFVPIIVFCVSLNFYFIRSAGHYSHLNVSALFSERGRSEYLYNTSPTRLAVGLINWLNLDKKGDVIFYAPGLAGTLNYNALHSSWYNWRLNDHLKAVESVEELEGLYRKYNSQYIVMSRSFGDPKIRKLIEQTSKLVKSFNGIDVREVIVAGSHN